MQHLICSSEHDPAGDYISYKVSLWLCDINVIMTRQTFRQLMVIKPPPDLHVSSSRAIKTFSVGICATRG